MIQIGGVYTTFYQEEDILLQKYREEMGGLSRYFSKVSGTGVDVTLLTYGGTEQQNPPHMTPHPRSRIRIRKQLRDLSLGRSTT